MYTLHQILTCLPSVHFQLHTKSKNISQTLWLLLYLLVKPVALYHWGIEVPLDGVGPLSKVVNFFRRPRRLLKQKIWVINADSQST